LVEPLSLDEAYLDVTENKKNIPSATEVAKEIKKKIKERLNLTASAGVSINKFLAKVASDMDKPDGLFVIPPKKTIEFIKKLPVAKIPGVGKVTAEKMKKMKINTGADLRKFAKEELSKFFGKVGIHYYKIVHNEYDSPVQPNRIRKSISSENTYADDLTDEKEMLKQIKKICEGLFKSMQKNETNGKTVTLKIKYHDFEQRTRSKTVTHYLKSKEELCEIAESLFWSPDKPGKPVRLFGVGVSNLNTEEKKIEKDQLDLSL
jgi:DNA polymerase-4